jgi:uncharacterized protein (TIGR02647 family)
MRFTAELLEELNLLALFDIASTAQEGIKVHQRSARPEVVAAAQRLFDKGLITQADGGYLTRLGQESAAHVQSLLTILTPPGQG